MLIWVAVGVDGLSTIEVPIFAEVSAASGFPLALKFC
jgi:hypothetical protein